MLGLFVSCSKGEKKDRVFFKKREKVTHEPAPPIEVEEGKEKEESITDVESIKDIGKVDKLTPEIFVKITILYRKESKNWVEKSMGLPPSEQEKFIEDANSKFFSSLGITEEEYLSFSEKNIDELNAYLKEHPELVPLIME
jgi:hypothetical protein